MTSPAQQKRICIGKITHAHGVKGLVKIFPYCENISLLDGKLFTSNDPDNTDTLTITIKSHTNKHILAKIDGITSPEDAKKLKCSLYIPRETLPETNDKDEFYIEDLIGLTAKSYDKNITLGTIKAIDNFGAGDLLEIKPNDGKAPYYVPFHDDYIASIDLDTRYIMLKNAEQFSSIG